MLVGDIVGPAMEMAGGEHSSLPWFFPVPSPTSVLYPRAQVSPVANLRGRGAVEEPHVGHFPELLDNQPEWEQDPGSPQF